MKNRHIFHITMKQGTETIMCKQKTKYLHLKRELIILARSFFNKSPQNIKNIESMPNFKKGLKMFLLTQH